jgi:Cof subfamily protein (haloacid dehalogenase superfamily)
VSLFLSPAQLLVFKLSWKLFLYSFCLPTLAEIIVILAMYKAVFIDMDGTLLRKDHTVSSITRHTIQQLIQKDILIVPISARPLHGMLPITQTVFPDDNPVVSLNGGYIYQQQAVTYQVHVTLPEAEAIHSEVKKQPVSAMYYSQMEWFAEASTDAVKKEQKITAVPITIQPFIDTLTLWEQQQTGPNKILIAGDPGVILSLEKELLANHSGELNIYKSQPRYLEVMSLQASKSKAIQFLMAQYGLHQNEVIAIGDNYNDKGMIEFAGTGVAMGNAPDEIKAVANYVTDTNNHDGVAKALKHFFDLK